MKLKVSLIMSLLTAALQAATSFSGSGVIGAKTSTGAANVTSGSLALLIVDIDGDGFLGMTGIITPGSFINTTFDPKLTSASASLKAGGLFGGDRIATVTTTGTQGSIAALLPSQDITSYLGKNFAVVWFDGVTTVGAPDNAAANSRYGIIRGNDWTFPIADVAGALTFNNSDNGGTSTLWQVNGGTGVGMNVAGFASATGTNTTTGSLAAATFVIVPEPSSALLLGVGALGLLRRRRI